MSVLMLMRREIGLRNENEAKCGGCFDIDRSYTKVIKKFLNSIPQTSSSISILVSPSSTQTYQSLRIFFPVEGKSVKGRGSLFIKSRLRVPFQQIAPN